MKVFVDTSTDYQKAYLRDGSKMNDSFTRSLVDPFIQLNLPPGYHE
jgi:hypothetical protein